MSFDPAHTLAEFARVTHERDELRRLATALLLTITEVDLGLWAEARALMAALPDYPKPAQDPIADAVEDEAYREAIVQARPRMFDALEGPLVGRHREHVRVLQVVDGIATVAFADGYEVEVPDPPLPHVTSLGKVVACACLNPSAYRCHPPEEEE